MTPDLMMPLMMMNMMNTGRKKEQDGGNTALMESLRKQNEMIMALNTGGYSGDNRENENTLLMNRLGELEEKLATKFNKSNQGAGGM